MIVLILTLAGFVVVAQPEVDTANELVSTAGKPALPVVPIDEFAGLTAREVMREGNRRLFDGKAESALGAYDKAAKLRPDAREIAFARGLANFDLKNFEEARTAFEQVAVEGTDSLATDAQYGIGASDHMEAIENTDNPELAISLLESAMRRYHRVLAENPKHQGARDANFKAASVWRRIKQMQEQQQSEDSNKEGDDQEESDQNKEKQESDEKKDQDQQQKDSNDKNSTQQESDEQKQESDPSDKQDEKKSEQQSAQQKEQKVSQEQAQRQLREMMQALRERQKARQAQIIKMPVAPVDKDW